MESRMDGNTLVISLEGHLDSSRTGAAEQEIMEVISKHPGQPYCLDADKLTFISSAGLRMLLRLRNRSGQQLTIRNVPPDVYEIFELTGFTSLFEVRKKVRQVRVEGCKVIGSGAFGTVYRLNDETVLKVYRGGAGTLPIIEDERNKARQAFLQGIPTAIPFDIVRVGEEYGTIFEMLDARNCNDIIRENPDAIGDLVPRYAAFLKEMHSKTVAQNQLPSARDRFFGYLKEASFALPEQISYRVSALLCSVPDELHPLHGDIHLKNVMASGDELMLVDMDKFCAGNPVFEFAGLYTAYILFDEVNPADSLQFFGIDQETAARIFHETLACYLGHPGEEAIGIAERKIRMLAALRQLYILMVEQRGDLSTLKAEQIRHDVEIMAELSGLVDSLAM